ncbi:hypothetical protein DFJ73DRAFT_756978 [Zopfochytrium polystomum]|nr:hypothetical protein DFJ73DRAFT_756978 [Zopfochytrium polystomum]
MKRRKQRAQDAVATACSFHGFALNMFITPVPDRGSLTTYTEGTRRRGKKPRVRHILFYEDERDLVEPGVRAAVRYNEVAAEASRLAAPPMLSYSVAHGDWSLQVWSQQQQQQQQQQQPAAPTVRNGNSRLHVPTMPVFEPSRMFDMTRKDDVEEAMVLLQVSLGVEPNPMLVESEEEEEEEEGEENG